MRFDFALASAYPNPFCTSVKISPMQLSTKIIASFDALQGADSLGNSAAYVVVVKMLTKVPAEILGLNKGELKAGKDADIIVFDEEIKVSDIFIAGEKRM